MSFGWGGGGGGLSEAQVLDAIYTAPVNDSLSGTGTTQVGATQLLAGKNRATTVTATDNAFVAPQVGDFIFLNSDSADTAYVFPYSGRDLGAGTDTAVAVPAGQSFIYYYFP